MKHLTELLVVTLVVVAGCGGGGGQGGQAGNAPGAVGIGPVSAELRRDFGEFTLTYYNLSLIYLHGPESTGEMREWMDGMWPEPVETLAVVERIEKGECDAVWEVAIPSATAEQADELVLVYQSDAPTSGGLVGFAGGGIEYLSPDEFARAMNVTEQFVAATKAAEENDSGVEAN